jgi:hypothetical protein
LIKDIHASEEVVRARELLEKEGLKVKDTSSLEIRGIIVSCASVRFKAIVELS